jgi:hypothetical protein
MTFIFHKKKITTGMWANGFGERRNVKYTVLYCNGTCTSQPCKNNFSPIFVGTVLALQGLVL